jgi:hypothetical protein
MIEYTQPFSAASFAARQAVGQFDAVPSILSRKVTAQSRLYHKLTASACRLGSSIEEILPTDSSITS